MNLVDMARALGGEVSNGQILCPGPNHSARDRSLTVRLSAAAPDGFMVFSHAGDPFAFCRDYVRDRLGWSSDRSTPRSAPSQHAPTRVVQNDDDLRARKKRAAEIWAEGVDPRGTLVEAYLKSRSLELPPEIAFEAIRFHKSCAWSDQVTGMIIRVPAMLTAMRDIVTNELICVQRTRLSGDGRKVDRRMIGVASGTAIKIDPDESVTMGLTVGEGAESCLAARQLGLSPVWALGSAGAVGQFPVLPGIEAITLLRERDLASERAVATCAVRWKDAGREVLIADPAIGNDMNDALRGVA